jgi:hypothetical protein
MSADALPLPPQSVGEAALRDAQKIADRISADEAAAAEARQAYEAGGLPVIEPEEEAARALLAPGELLHAMHASALLETHSSGDEEALPRGGTLYLTSIRVVHVGKETTEVSLSQMEDAAVALERLVQIRLRDGSDLAIEVDQPRLLRVQVATALAGIRATQT